MATGSSHSSSSLQYSSGASNSSTSSSTTAAAAGLAAATFRPDKDQMWYFTAEQLENSPSRRHGIDAATELYYRQITAHLIQDMGQRLDVSQLCINTAIVYMHRFYAFHSFTHFHRNGMASACIFLSCKVEEQPRKLEHVIRAAQICTNPEQGSNLQKEVYNEKAQDLVFNENVLLQTLGFDVAIDHPHTHVVKTCHLVKACKDLAQTSYFLASNSLHLTSMCLQYKPTVVACFCIYLACKWSRWEIPQSTEGKHWFYYVDKNVTMDLLKLLTDEFIAIYEKSPARLKSKLINIKNLAQGKRTSEQPQQQPQQPNVSSTGLQMDPNMIQHQRSSGQHSSSGRSHHHDNGDHKHKQQYGNRPGMPPQGTSKNPIMQPPNVPTSASRSSSSSSAIRPSSSHPPTNPPRTSSSQDPNYHKNRSNSNNLPPNVSQKSMQKPLPNQTNNNPKDISKDKKFYSQNCSAVDMSKSDPMLNFNRNSKYDMHSVQHQSQQQKAQQVPTKKQNSESLEFAQSYQQTQNLVSSLNKPHLFNPDWQPNSYPPNKRPMSDAAQNDESGMLQRDTKMRKLETKDNSMGLFGNMNSTVPSTGIETNPDLVSSLLKESISSGAVVGSGYIKQEILEEEELPSLPDEPNLSDITGLLPQNVLQIVQQHDNSQQQPSHQLQQQSLSQQNSQSFNPYPQMMQLDDIPSTQTILPPTQQSQLQISSTLLQQQQNSSISVQQHQTQQQPPQQQHSTSPSADELSAKKSEKKKKKDKHKHKEKDKSKDKEEKDRDKKKHKKDKDKHKDRLSGTESEPVKLKISKDKLNLENGGNGAVASNIHGTASDGFKIKIPKDKLNGYHDQPQMDGNNGLRIKISKEKLESSGIEDSGHNHSSSSKKKDKDRDKEKKRSSGDFKQSGNGSSSNGGSSSKNQSKIQPQNQQSYSNNHHHQQQQQQHNNNSNFNSTNHHRNMSQLFGDQSNEEDDDGDFTFGSSASSVPAPSFKPSYQQQQQQQQQNW